MTAPDITARLHTMSGMLQMGERIAYGSDAALMSAAADEIASLRAQVEAAQADAERYQWLRDKAVEHHATDTVWCVQGSSWHDCEPIEGEKLDEAIHKARGVKQ
jgi:hypothetical protein